MNYLLVGIGGMFGGVTRYKLGQIISQNTTTAFPVGTFIINITGALLLGILTALTMEKNIYLLFGDGFLGAYTTFSTFMYEGFNLFKQSEKLNAFVYILGSLIIGIMGYTLGFAMINYLNFNI